MPETNFKRPSNGTMAATAVLVVGVGFMAYYFLKNNKQGTVTPPPPGPTPTPKPPTPTSISPGSIRVSYQVCPYLQRGASGQMVKDLQRALTALGDNPITNMDGVFGSITDSAVRKFQLASGIVVDGIVGRQTYSSLNWALSHYGGGFWTCGTLPPQIASGGSGGGTSSGSGSGSGTSTYSGGAPKVYLSSCSVLSQGSSGTAVTDLQRALSYISAASGHAAINPRGIDGTFGPNTAAAVRSFQAFMGISVDGVAGAQTFGELNHYLVGHGGYWHCGNLVTVSGSGTTYSGDGPSQSQIEKAFNAGPAGLSPGSGQVNWAPGGSPIPGL